MAFRVSHFANKRFLILILCLLMLACSQAPQAGKDKEANYCHDPDANAEWDRLLARNPDDMEIQALHALRIGLCQKVDEGHLTIEQATKIFEAMRAALVKKRELERKLSETDKNKML